MESQQPTWNESKLLAASKPCTALPYIRPKNTHIVECRVSTLGMCRILLQILGKFPPHSSTKDLVGEKAKEQLKESFTGTPSGTLNPKP